MSAAPELWAQLMWAARGLRAVAGGQSSTEWLGLCPAEWRPGVQSILLGALRHWGLARALRQHLVPKPPHAVVDHLLTLSLALLAQDPPPYTDHALVSQAVEAAKREPKARALAGLVNACLRRMVRERPALLELVRRDPQALYNHPRWWIEQLQRDHPQDWTAILSHAQRHPPMVLRLNARRVQPEPWLRRCHEAGIEAHPLGGMAMWLPRPVPVAQIPGFLQGECSVQDGAAQQAAHLLLDALGPAPGRPWRVLDACAAPGGKTAHLLECADLDLLALDVDAQRLGKVRETLSRLGLQAQTRVADAARPQTWAQPQDAFDGILLDAPCSASGIVRRHPDIAWLRRPQDLQGLAEQQRRLLDALWPRVRPGGFLLYCTCSVFRIEGESQISSFVGNNTDALRRPAPGHLIPRMAGNGATVGDNAVCEVDGFFYALLQKRT